MDNYFWFVTCFYSPPVTIDVLYWSVNLPWDTPLSEPFLPFPFHKRRSGTTVQYTTSKNISLHLQSYQDLDNYYQWRIYGGESRSTGPPLPCKHATDYY